MHFHVSETTLHYIVVSPVQHPIYEYIVHATSTFRAFCGRVKSDHMIVCTFSVYCRLQYISLWVRGVHNCSRKRKMEIRSRQIESWQLHCCICTHAMVWFDVKEHFVIDPSDCQLVFAIFCRFDVTDGIPTVTPRCTLAEEKKMIFFFHLLSVCSFEIFFFSVAVRGLYAIEVFSCCILDMCAHDVFKCGNNILLHPVASRIACMCISNAFRCHALMDVKSR